jgi:MFS family permease
MTKTNDHSDSVLIKAKSSKQILTLLFLGVFLGALDIAIIGPAKVPIQEALKIGEREWPWAINMYILLNLVSTPLMAKLSDLLGRRWIYISAVSLFAIGSLVVILSNSFTTFVVGRAIQGFGAGGIFPVASAVIGDTIPKEKQGSALGMIGAVFGLAFMVGPPLGGLLLNFSWHWLFIVNIPLALVIIVLAIKVIPSHRTVDKIHFDWRGMTLLITSLSLFALSVTRIDTKDVVTSILKPDIWPLLATSIFIAPVFFMWQHKTPNPIINPRLMRSRRLILVYLLAFGAGLSQVIVMYLPGIAKVFFGFDNSHASYAVVPLILGLFIGAPMAGKLLDKFGPKAIIFSGTIILTLGLFGLWLVSASKAGFYTSEVFVGLGLSALIGAPLRFIMNTETHEEDRASGQGMITLFTSSGQIFGAATFGALIASLGGGTIGFMGAFQALAFVSLLLIIVALVLKPAKK